MGLDGVELILAVEEKFGFEITDEEAEKLKTIGDLHRHVCNKLVTKSSPICATSRAFYTLRRAFMRVLGVPRSSIRPETPLSTLFPVESRRDHWAALNREVETCLRLRRPAALVNWPMIFVFLALVAVIVVPDWRLKVFMIILLAAFIPCAVIFTRPYATLLPSSISTVRDLTLLTANRFALTDEEMRVNEADVLAMLKQTISAMTDVPVEALSESTNFHHDLGF